VDGTTAFSNGIQLTERNVCLALKSIEKTQNTADEDK
jgi:hypothetical protein